MKKLKNTRFLIVYTLALFSAAALIITVSYLYKTRAELERELVSVRYELELANQRYTDLITSLEEQ